MQSKRVVKRGEALAIMSEAVHADHTAMWFDAGTMVPENQRIGSVEVVTVRGALSHHAEPGSDSYDGILARVRAALDGDEGMAPDVVVMRIDSPGGVVSGLNETVFALRRMADEKGVPLIAFVDELAASAAYALACACSEIVAPPSAIVGSIGVISGMYDQVKADEQMGINFVTITSGAHKADGHPHVALNDSAVQAEQRRVDRLAKQFFNLVADVRPLSVEEIEGYQAGVFLAREAEVKGLADAVMGWDEMLAALNENGTVNKKTLANVGQAESAIKVTAHVGTNAKETRKMSLVAFKALINRATAALAAETDPKNRTAISGRIAAYTAALEAFKKEKHTIEKHEIEEGGDEEAESDDCDEEASDESSDKDASSADDSEDGDDDESDDEEAGSKKSTKAIAALVHQLTGKKGNSAVGALAAMIAEGQRASATVTQITKERRAEKKGKAIDEALGARRITKSEATTLRAKPLSFVESFLEMRPKAVVHTDDDSIHIPDPNARPGAHGGLSPEVVHQVELAVSSAPKGVDREKLRTSMFEAHQKRMTAGLNGVGRY